MKKNISIFMIIVFMTAFTGCKESKQEINQMGTVLATGFDLTEDGKYIITVQILNPQGGGSDTSKKSDTEGKSDVTVFSSESDTPSSAPANLAESYGKPIFFGHSKYVVLGERLAKTGVTKFMDSVFRIRTTRPDVAVFVTKGNASDIIKADLPDEKISADKVENLIKFQGEKGYSPMTSRLRFANALMDKIRAPILGVINIKNEFNSDNTFDVSGTAVFKEDKLIGYMDMNETRGMQWINGKVQSGSIVGHLPNNKVANFYILKSRSKIKPVLKNGSLRVEVNIFEEGNVIEMSAPLNPMENYKVMDKLSEVQSNAIKGEALLALNTAQKKYDADVFGFANAINETYPDFWNKIKSNWPSIFQKLKVDVNVTSSVKRPGIISKPIG
ncbi:MULTISPECIES: Ger(x)C family spore germination protein [Clostridium]|uniref:Ger(x)C family spore germination protein n=1 Tax=Clostridium TaxID=1485 RepID=UPI0008250D9D|nr:MULTISPECIES: Ger(x)C family spore germination protein [Clostridium]PJI10432.1 Ger(x)C family spore germination protein [Clostridium sp. CT7]